MKKNNFIRFIFSFVITTLLLLSYNSFAFPTAYTYTNFFSGATIGYFSSDDNMVYDLSGSATSYAILNFNNIIMSGAQPSNGVPVVNMNANLGKYSVLKPGGVAVLKGSSINELLFSSNLSCYLIGTTTASNKYTNLMSEKTGLADTSAGLITLKSATGFSTTYEHFFLFVYNAGSTDVRISVNGYSSAGDIEIPFRDIHDMRGVTGSWYIKGSNTTTKTYYFWCPHLDAYEDIYIPGPSCSKVSSYSLSRTFTIKYDCRTNVKSSTQIWFTTNANLGYSYNSTAGGDTAGVEDLTHGAPLFLKSTNELNRYSVNINNTRELAYYIAQAIKESEGGSEYPTTNDILLEILHELELANSGGELGDLTRQAMEQLETQHSAVVDQGDEDFNSVVSIFNQYKSLFNFNDDLHWIVVANNALFNYFAGFVLLCVVLLIFDRILRG